jgi:CheY-like chemotaxis protein
MPNQILILDDSPDDALLLEGLLRRKCVANPIRSLTDGLLAMDYLLGKAPYSDRELHPFPAVLFMELELPGKNGLEILQWLRDHPEVPRPRVIMYTKHTAYGELEKAYLLGADAILIKQTLQEQITAILALLSESWEFGDPASSVR